MELATLVLQHWGIRQHRGHPSLAMVSVRGILYWGTWCGIGRDSVAVACVTHWPQGGSVSIFNISEFTGEVS